MAARNRRDLFARRRPIRPAAVVGGRPNSSAGAAERAATAAAVRALLVEGARLSLRDAAELLGLSPSRVQQIHAAERHP